MPGNSATQCILGVYCYLLGFAFGFCIMQIFLTDQAGGHTCRQKAPCSQEGLDLTSNIATEGHKKIN